MSSEVNESASPVMVSMPDPDFPRGEVEFRTLTEAAPVGIFLTNGIGDTLFVNETWCRLAGIPAHEALGRGWEKSIHPDDLDRIKTEWRQSVLGREFSICEFRFLRPDGSVSWILGHAVPQKDPFGNLIGYVGSCVDVTEQRQADALMAAQKAVLEKIAHEKPLAEVLQAIAKLLEEQCPGSAAEVLLAGPDGETLQRGAAPTSVIVASANSRAGEWSRIQELPAERGLKSGWQMPVTSKDGVFLGVLALYFREKREPDSRETHVTQVLSGLVELAITRLKSARQFNQLSEESQRRMRLYEGILSTTPDLAYVFDLDHRFIYANAALLGMWGKTAEEALGRNCLELGYEPWHAAMHDREIEQVIATKMPIRGDVPFDGTYGRRLYDYIFTPILGADGNVEAIAGTTRDVTERKRSEQRAHFLSDLTNSLARLTDAQEIIRVATRALREKVGAHRCYFVECNEEEDRLFVHKGAAMAGAVPIFGELKLFQFGGYEWWKQYSSGNFQIEDIRTNRFTEERQDVYAAIQVLSYAVQPFKDDEKTTVVLAVTQDEPRRWTEEEMALVEDVVARVWPMVRNARAVTELDESRQHLRLLLESAGIILGADDPDLMLQEIFHKLSERLGVDAYFNFMVDEAGQGLMLKSIGGIPESEHARLQRIEFGQAVCGAVAGERKSIIAPSVQTSGDPRVELVKSMGIRAYASYPLISGGNLIGTLSFASTSKDEFSPNELEIMHTISHYVTGAYARIRLVDSLRESDRKKDQFLATLAHELRNPLAPILTGLDVMLARPEDGGKVWEVAGMMQRQVGQMVHLIDDLLDMSRVTTGKIALRKATVALADIIGTSCEASEGLMQQYGHQFSVALPDQPVTLLADPHRISQVISNLLSNAAKYTQPGGRIELSAVRGEDDSVAISVKDNGYGIQPADQGRIFKLFEQDDHGRNDGLGIGLTLVKSLVELHGGTVTVRSEGPMKGSEFIVRLPALPEEEAAAHPAAKPVAAAAAVNAPKRVLVADDGRSAADVLGMFFEMEGMQVAVAYDGLEAVEAAQDFEPDLVFMDLGMPRMDGFEAARILRDRFPDVKMVALSGWGRDEDRRKSAEAGFIEHLIKPVSPQDLRTVLGRLISAGH